MKDGKKMYYAATGFLEERFRNVRKRKRSNPGSSVQMPVPEEPQRPAIPGKISFLILNSFVLNLKMYLWSP